MGNRRLLFLSGVLAVNYLLFQSILVPHGNGNGNASWSSVPEKYASLDDKVRLPSLHSTPKYFTVWNWNPPTGNVSKFSNSSTFIARVKKVHIPIVQTEIWHSKRKRIHNDRKSNFLSERKGSDDVSKLRVDKNDVHSLPKKKDVGKNDKLELESVGTKRGTFTLPQMKNSYMGSSEHDKVSSPASYSTTSSTRLRNSPQKSDILTLDNNISASIPRRKMRCEMPPKSRMLIQEMNHLLVRRRASSRAMRPRWSSKLDLEILAARSEIEHAPIVTHDKELYAPLFRNLSMFKRSYELMERTLKVYIYMDGNKPIFHQPILKGLYASEGWFMKLMEENKHFVVKDPAKAHLFYMPFSSRMLEYSLYVRNSHNRTNLRRYLKEYTDKISAKYKYFNRTGGADHFLVACHDWAPYETRHHMEYCIKALCNADVTQGFKIGRDVSLPEAYVRSARNPQRDLGGKPPHQRPVLAFYAGNMHGYLRPILLKHWKGRDPDMKIYGPMPPGVASKMNYIQHMKNSKYCICPKGYEVNSPRVVEAIFYECVPVIISDNFVPPFFEVLNWDAFSLILAEKDIPNLKQILLLVPQEKYIKLQLGVRKVQKHFFWHTKPSKYDLFHMTLHSVWYNRVFQINVKRKTMMHASPLNSSRSTSDKSL
ncbi:probable glycosyltransferase At3g07620 isoform X1 [Abrus precatorius]|uniref:Probable glycosyltransferase At3g07620 isoform X1 n=2 Tax=Abrus precatorius TaxID=3816 RepID=A0A8B8KE52_ABRPR|nr:probable glycosyltransferase At3g07620 isoform X1 [Abrus precatorius]